jgi:hypothetical protein
MQDFSNQSLGSNQDPATLHHTSEANSPPPVPSLPAASPLPSSFDACALMTKGDLASSADSMHTAANPGLSISSSHQLDIDTEVQAAHPFAEAKNSVSLQPAVSPSNTPSMSLEGCAAATSSETSAPNQSTTAAAAAVETATTSAIASASGSAEVIKHGFCLHGARKSECRHCGGRAICEHGRRRRQCTKCRGSGICCHGKRKGRCFLCNGVGICEHMKLKSRCKICSPAPRIQYIPILTPEKRTDIFLGKTCEKGNKGKTNGKSRGIDNGRDDALKSLPPAAARLFLAFPEAVLTDLVSNRPNPRTESRDEAIASRASMVIETKPLKATRAPKATPAPKATAAPKATPAPKTKTVGIKAKKSQTAALHKHSKRSEKAPQPAPPASFAEARAATPPPLHRYLSPRAFASF